MEIIRGEIRLTIDIIIGLVIGEIITRLKLADMLMKKFMPVLERHNIPDVTGLALAVSAGSSKTGAAIIASALECNAITENSAVWSVLMLPLPSYLRRWPGTFALSVSLAGTAGGIFAVSLLVRSILRFVMAFMFLKREGVNSPREHHELVSVNRTGNILLRLMKTLPFAWVFFALAYSLVPVINRTLSGMFPGNAAVWTVAAGSVAHVSAALALAGGAMSAGELTTAQAVFALILGSGLGTATRILRQNAGYYFGLFPVKVARRMLIMNFTTIMPLIVINLLLAGIALLF